MLLEREKLRREESLEVEKRMVREKERVGKRRELSARENNIVEERKNSEKERAGKVGVCKRFARGDNQEEWRKR